MKSDVLNMCSLFLASLLALGGSAAGLAQNTPGYNNKIPESILTPDHVETPIGDLNFFDGLPDEATVQKLYDNLIFMRGVEAFLSGIPATSIEAIRLGCVEVGAKRSSDIVLFDKLMDSDPLFLTGNTDTVYALSILELDRDGPTVVVIPPKCGPGTVDDAWQRFVVDMGAPGLDKGKGGKYLILPPDYDGDLDPPVGGEFAEVDGEKYIVAKSPTYVNWLVLRGFLVDGKPDAANSMFENGLKIYPLEDRKNPPKMKFISGSEVPFNTVHANTFLFYEELNHIIQREPLSLIDPELRGLIASIGIQKGKPFEPDARTKELLTKAVAVGNATARAIFFRPYMKEAFLYEDSGWFAAFVGGSHEWLKDKGQGGRYLDARTLCFYMGTVNTPAMVNKMVGAGSQYAMIAVDENSEYLDGGKTYKLNLPAKVPAKDFWSIVVYDPQTRSQLQTSQPFPAKNNKRHKLDTNKDGSVDLYFGPKAPKGKEANWIQTVPGKGWFTALRLYGPLEPWFDKTWRPGEIELVE